MPLTSQEMRDVFPIARRYAYLDHASIAPLATPVRTTMEVFLNRQSEEPFDLDHWERLRIQVRARIAGLVGARPEAIAFTKNTTSGREGDNIVGVDGEFPANIYPWLGLKDRGVSLRLCPHEAGRVDTRALLRLCDERTRVVAISLVQFWSGFRCDLQALSNGLRSSNALLVVDGMQAVGVLQVQLGQLAVDVLACGAQKWMLGPTGIGFAYLSQRALERVRPVLIGIDSVVRDREYFEYDLTFKPDARRFEEAAPNWPGILGMGAAVNLLVRAGPAAVESGALRLADRLREELVGRGFKLVFTPQQPGEKSAIVSFRHARMVPAEVHRRLHDAGIILSLRGNFLRASPHYYNSDADIDRLLEALPQ
jgi:selenocysteine lyase/cysteine desulfurase